MAVFLARGVRSASERLQISIEGGVRSGLRDLRWVRRASSLD